MAELESYWYSGCVTVCPSRLSFRYCPLTAKTCPNHMSDQKSPFTLSESIRVPKLLKTIFNTWFLYISSKKKKSFYFNFTSVDNRCPLAVMETSVSPKGCPDDGWHALLQTEINRSNCEGSSGVLLQHPSDTFYLNFTFLLLIYFFKLAKYCKVSWRPRLLWKWTTTAAISTGH